MSRPCVTHHHACDCREAAFAALETDNVRLRELTAQLVSAVEAALRAAYDMAARLTAVQNKE